jgi:hypothetical protein
MFLTKIKLKNYFKTIKKLNGEGFNPKANFPPNIVSDANIAKVFGMSFEGFKTTNLNFHPKTKKDFLGFYWKMYGTNQVTNNKFMIWFVKACIPQEKGKKVSWARAAALMVEKKPIKKKQNE